MNCENSTETYTFPCVEQIAGGRLLSNTGSSAWRSVTTERRAVGWGVRGGLRGWELMYTHG